MRLPRAEVMLAVTRSVNEDCPDVVAIKADNNNLTRLDWFANLVHVAPDVRALDLSTNGVSAAFACLQ